MQMTIMPEKSNASLSDTTISLMIAQNKAAKTQSVNSLQLASILNNLKESFLNSIKEQANKTEILMKENHKTYATIASSGRPLDVC